MRKRPVGLSNTLIQSKIQRFESDLKKHNLGGNVLLKYDRSENTLYIFIDELADNLFYIADPLELFIKYGVCTKVSSPAPLHSLISLFEKIRKMQLYMPAILTNNVRVRFCLLNAKAFKLDRVIDDLCNYKYRQNLASFELKYLDEQDYSQLKTEDLVIIEDGGICFKSDQILLAIRANILQSISCQKYKIAFEKQRLDCLLKTLDLPKTLTQKQISFHNSFDFKITNIEEFNSALLNHFPA